MVFRPFLAVAPTLLTDSRTGKRLPFRGLYAGHPLPAGAFLGFYNGEWLEAADGHRSADPSYTMEVSTPGGGVAHITPTTRDLKGRICAATHMMAMCNEPPAGTEASVCFVPLFRAGGVVPLLPKKASIAALALYTCRAVKAGDELYVHYGKDYPRRKYPRDALGAPLVGAPCKPLPRNARETPGEMMQAHGLSGAVPPDCYRAYD